ncbi:OPA3-domain-containing protein [Metschnikowia bicuspidata]|uniref:OPA3-domain-containing protein n=1 Tax=Metschnikowia bicuspidata TaxID=27322 RepID=A0A4P9Z8M4_9ASCO|nr:OPA3-domain-containing protein [Metschnikowia bicuspidata]
MSGLALKFTSLVVRTVAKPFAGALKAQAKEHEFFKQACILLAQRLHLADVKMRMLLLGENKIKVRPLNDKKAVENGANFLLELFIFLVAGLLILYESYRSRAKANAEKENVKNEISELQEDIIQMKALLERLTDGLERMSIGVVADSSRNGKTASVSDPVSAPPASGSSATTSAAAASSSA